MGAGLRPTAKAMEEPPDPTVRARVLDPTDHLISHNREGVLLNFYVTVIGVTLMYLHMGHRPSKYLFLMMGMVANGSATLEEVMPILRERERQCKMQRDRVARKRTERPK